MYAPRPAPTRVADIATAPAFAYLRAVGPHLRVEVRWRTPHPARDIALHISFVREFETGWQVRYLDGDPGTRGYSLPMPMLDRLVAWLDLEVGAGRSMWLDEPRRRPAEAAHR